jgi:MinD superfamily P-loop ATPase
MKKITIISGKGGTGKTSLVGSFAALAKQKAVLVDADVDAANLSLIMKPTQIEKHDFRASRVASIDSVLCSSCDLCHELCRFGAISDLYLVDPVSCEGCAFCSYVCPQDAIKMVERVSGQWFVSATPYGTLVHARLGIAEENSGKLVTNIRKKAQEIAVLEDSSYLIIDGPPGIGCPVIASLSGVDAALVVTEPTVSGIHDLERVIAVCRHFGVPVSVCINRADLAEEQAEAIEEYCLKENIAMVGKIPYDRAFVEAMIKGIPVVEHANRALTEKISAVWEVISA